MQDRIIIKIKGREYTINYPNVGEYYKIEAMKQALGKGFYNTLVQTPTQTALNALDMIDVDAVFTVLCPSLMEDLKVKSFQDLGIVDFKCVRDVYVEQVLPFLKEINDLLSDVKE